MATWRKQRQSAKKALFLIDSVISVTFFVMMLATIIAHFHLYKISMDNIKERWELKELLIKSFDTIARNETTSGDECIIRYYGEKEVICRESN